MTKKHLLIVGIIFSSLMLFAKPALFISGNTAECTGYTGFLGTDAWTVHKKINVQGGWSFNEKWTCYLCAGADFCRELKTFTPFSSLTDSFSMRCGIGGRYSEDNFALDLNAGLEITDMAMDSLNKYADIYSEFTLSVQIFRYGGFAGFFTVPLSFAFNGCGCNFDLGLGTSIVYRVFFGGSK